MPVTFATGFFDRHSLPDCSMGLLNRACDWLERHPETRDVPADKLAEFSSDVDQAVQPLLCAGIAVRGKKGGIRLAGNCGITITLAAARPAAPSAPSAHRTALYRLPALKKELRARDGDQCRYCATRVHWGAGQAADSGVWDWLEPGGPASAENVVTACKACCDGKGGLSLKESGMALLPPPAPQKRHNPCDASDLGKPGRDASRDASKRHSDASGEKTQVRSVTGKRADRSDLDLYKDQSLETEKSKSDARAREEAALAAELADLACAEHGFTPDEAWARSLIAAVDERIRTRKTPTRIRSRRGYIIRSAKDRALWESTRPVKAPAPARDETPAGTPRNPWIPAERHEFEPGGPKGACRRCKCSSSYPGHVTPGEKAG